MAVIVPRTVDVVIDDVDVVTTVSGSFGGGAGDAGGGVEGGGGGGNVGGSVGGSKIKYVNTV